MLLLKNYPYLCWEEKKECYVEAINLFIVALLFALWGQAQTETTLRHIDILAYNTEGELYFYWQKGKDKFLELELGYKEDEKADYKQDLYDIKIVHYNDENWETQHLSPS